MRGPARSMAWILVAAVLYGLPAAASWYGENVARGSDILLVDLRWPYWPEHARFVCWDASFVPEGGGFRVGLSGALRAEDRTRLEVCAEFRPAAEWSFWGHADYRGRAVSVVYADPCVGGSAAVGEGALAEVGAARLPWLRANAWYRWVLRVWRPLGETPEPASYCGWWLKDLERNEWHHYATVLVPCRATGVAGNAGALEDLGNGGRSEQELHRRLGYCRVGDTWRKSDVVSIDTGLEAANWTPHWLVRLLEDDTVLALQFTLNPNAGRNLEPRPGQPYAFTTRQPDDPPLDALRLESVRGECLPGQLAVCWTVPADSAPAFAYRVEVFDNPAFKGRPRTVVAAREPHVRSCRLDTAVATPFVRLTVTDLFDREVRVPVPAGPIAGLRCPVAAEGLVQGLQAEVYELPAGCERLPGFDDLCPVRTGTVLEPRASLRREVAGACGLRFSGYLQVPRNGFYTLVVRACDGFRLRLDGQTAAEHDGLHGPGEVRFPVTLGAGAHPAELTFLSARPEQACLWLGWEGPGLALQEIQAAAWQRLDDGEAPTVQVELPPSPAATEPAELSCRLDLRGHAAERVEYFTGAFRLGTVTQPPYSLRVLLPAGENRVWARLTVEGGVSAEAPPVVVIGTDGDLAPWAATALGEAGLPRAFRMDGGTVQFTGTGEYLVRRRRRGDFTLTARVCDLSGARAAAGAAAWIGLSAREYERPGEGYEVGLYRTAGLGIRGSPDRDDPEGGRLSLWQVAGGREWLRLVRTGPVFRGYTSADGQAWAKAFEYVVPLRDDLLVGLCFRTPPAADPTLLRGTVSDLDLAPDAWDDGLAPVAADPGSGPRLTGLVQSPADPSFLVARGTHTGLLASRDGGITWAPLNAGLTEAEALSVRSVALHPRDPALLLRGGGLAQKGGLAGGLWKSTDGGRSWRRVRGDLVFDGRAPECVGGEALSFCPAAPARVLAATPAGLYLSTDAGDSWTPVGLRGEHVGFVAFHPYEQRPIALAGTVPGSQLARLDAAGSAGGRGRDGHLVLSLDGGRTWVAQRDVPDLGFLEAVFDRRANSLVLLATTRGLFRADQFGHRLYQVRGESGVAPDVPYAAVAAAVRDPADLYGSFSECYAAPLVAGRGPGLAYSDLLGYAWQPVDPAPEAGPGAALPGGVVTVLVDASSRDRLYAATATGLWQSPNRGRTWRKVYELSVPAETGP